MYCILFYVPFFFLSLSSFQHWITFLAHLYTSQERGLSFGFVTRFCFWDWCLKINKKIRLQGRIQDFSWGVAELKQRGQFVPCDPHMAPNSVLQLGILVFWAPYGPDFRQKLALFMTKIRNFFIKYQCLGQKMGPFPAGARAKAPRV